MKILRTAKVHSTQKRTHRQKRSRSRLASIALLPLAVAIGQALANPEGGVVVGGQAAINQKPGITTVDQASDRAIINWRGFSIDRGELTRFNQPGKNAIALNRVLGKDPSKLLGQLKANGHVWLVNPNGILFGPSARIDVHGLLATTADIRNQDFLAGRNNFSIPSPNAGASVVNQGNISIGEHGLAGLVAPHVRNAGVIQGKMGQVVIAGAPTFTLDFYGDGLIQFEATSKVTENTNPADPLVRNDGKISVDGGDVLITANAAAGVVDEAINMDGIIEARSVGMENGAIVLKGGDVGIVHVAGGLDASGAEPGTTGGSVDILGDKVLVADSASIDTSASSGGGTVHVGGDLRGEGDRPTASQTIVMPEAQITADATDAGDGGQVVVWADERAEIHGQITARGGTVSGNGGLIETSARKQLILTSSPDASAPNGKGGTWLIDPANITIASGDDGAIGTNTVGAVLINNALNTGTSVTLDTRPLEDAEYELGEIIQEQGATISKTAGGDATLTLRAEDSIRLVENIISTANELTLNLVADSDETGTGTVRIFSIVPSEGPVIIDTNGGNLTARGNTLSETGDSIGISISGTSISSGGGDINLTGIAGLDIPGNQRLHLPGVSLRGADIDSGGGEINLTGGNDGDTSGNGIFLNNSSINSNGGPINLVGVGSNSGTDSWGIWITESSSIDSVGGQIRLTGEAGDNTVIADFHRGILIDNSRISAGGGDIELTGTPGTQTTFTELKESDVGIELRGNNVVETTGIGTITLNGSGGFGALDGSKGIAIRENSKVLSENGNIELIGTGGGNFRSPNNEGISIFSGGAVISTGSGNITLDGTGGVGTQINTGISIINATVSAGDGNIKLVGKGGSGKFFSNGIRINENSVIQATGTGTINLDGGASIRIADLEPDGSNGFESLNTTNDITTNIDITTGSGGGTITFIADGMHLGDAAEISGTGILQLQPKDPAVNIEVGGITTESQLHLSSSELATLQDGFSRILIGHADGTGAIASASAGVTFNDSLTLQSPGPGGSITTNGPVQVNGGDLALIAGDAIDVNGNISTTATGGSIEISSGGAIVMNPGSAIDTNGGNVILGGGLDPLNNPAVGTADHIDGIIIRGATINSGGGNISLRGNGFSTALNDASGIDLRGVEQEVEGEATTFDALIISGDGDIKLTGIGGENATGERNRGINIQDSARIVSTGSGTIALDGTGGSGTNDNTGVFLSSNAAISSANGELRITGKGGNGGDITRGIRLQNGATVASTEGAAIILNGTQGGTDTNSILATGNGGISTSGTTTLVAGTGDITLNTINNDFGSVVVSSARDVTIGDINGIDLGTSVVSGDLRVTAGAADDIVFGGMAVSGVITAGGSVVLDVIGDLEVDAPITADDFVSLRARENQDTAEPGDILVNATITAGFGPGDSEGSIDALLGADRHIILNSGGDLSVATRADLSADSNNNGTGIIDNPGNTTISLSDILVLEAADGIGLTNPIQTVILEDSAGFFDIEINAETATGDIRIANTGVEGADAGGVELTDFESPSFITDGLVAVNNFSGDLIINTRVQGGEVSFTTSSLADINANVSSTDGAIDITSDDAVDTSDGELDSNGGDVTIVARGDVDTGNIFTGFTETSAGNILVTSSEGAIDTTKGELNAATNAGDAGAVRLEAAGDITTSDIFASSLSGDGGDITLVSNSGSIDTSSGELNSISLVGNAGAIQAQASGDITTGNVFASALNGGGNGLSDTGSSGGINLNSLGGDIVTGGLLSPSEAAFGSAGSSGDIVVAAANGSITIDGLVWAFSNAAVDGGAGDAGDGGAVILSAANNITVLGVEGSENPFSIQSKSRSDAGSAGNGSSITITSTGGNISVNGDISSSSIGTDDSGSAGDVVLTAPGTITLDNIDASAGDLTAGSTSGSGGSVTLTASSDTSVGDISSAASGGQGGAIDLNSDGNITAGSITLGSISGQNGAPLTADAAATIEIAELIPNGADVVLGQDIVPGSILLPSAVDTRGGNMTIFVGNEYTFATDLTTDQGDFTLEGLQAVTLTSSIETNGGDVNVLTGSGSLTLDGPVSAGDPVSGSATIELMADSNLILNDDIAAQSIVLRAGNAITQAEGASISATNLGVAAVAAPALDVVTEDVTTFAAQISGLNNPFSITSNNELIVAQVDSLPPGISTNNGDVTVQTTAGALTLNGPVSAGDPLSGSATIGLTAGSDLILNDDIAAQSIVLRAGNAITQAGDASISATNLGVAAGAATALDVGSGDVTTLAAQITGAGNPFSFTDNNGLIVGQVDSLTGISTNNGDLTVQTTAGALTLNGPVSAGDPLSGSATIGLTAGSDLILNNHIAAQSILLRAGNAITQAGDASISATNLGVAAEEAPALTVGSGDVVTLAAQITGADNSFSFTDNNGLVVGQVGSLTGISTNNGDVTVQTETGALTLDGPVSAGDPVSGSATIELTAGSDLILNDDVTAQSIVLRAGNAITQSEGASISATNLGVAAVAATVLDVGTGDVVTLAAQITGAGNPFTFTDNNGLVVGLVDSLAGISTNNGDVRLDVAGDLSVDEPISTGGSIVLQATENIAINAPFDLTPQAAGERVVLQAGDNITVNAAIITQGSDLHLEANSPHQDFGANGRSVGGITTSASAPLATNGGDITLIGTGAIDMQAVFDAGDGTISHSPPGPFSIVVTDNANFLSNARTTGALVLGRAQSAGDDGFGTASETFTASDITFNTANLEPAVASEINAIATNNVTFEGVFATGQALFINADADADGSGAISTKNGTITPGGPLQLTAGGDIAIDTANLGSVAALTTGGDIAIENTRGSSTVTTVGDVAGLTAADGDVKFVTDGGLTLEQPIQATTSNIDPTSILLAVKDEFVNEFTDVAGETALQPGDGRYLVYSSDPADDTRGVPDDQFTKRYSVTFDPDDPQGADAGLPSNGNFFLYEITPILTLIADNASRGLGEPNPALTFTYVGLIDGDPLETALAEPPILATTAVATSLPGDYPILVGPSDLGSPLGYAIETEPGTLTVSASGLLSSSAELPASAKPPPIAERVVPVVPLVLTEYPRPAFVVPAVGSRRESSSLLSPNDGNRELWGPPR